MTEDSNKLDDKIVAKIDDAFNKKKADDGLNDSKVDDIIDTISKKYEAKLAEMEAKFAEKFDSTVTKYNDELKVKDETIAISQSNLDKVNDSINSRKSLTSDNVPPQPDMKNMDDVRKAYREMSEKEKINVDTEYFNQKLARHASYR